MQLVLFEPEIPPNTGNVARLCAATGVSLHLIEPLGFKLENRYLKRAGLDYWPNVDMHVWPDWAHFMARPDRHPQERLVMTSAKVRGQSMAMHRFAFAVHDCLVMGPETRGLPQGVLATTPHHIYIPMRQGGVRSLNLSTAAGIVLYAALANCGLLEHLGSV